MGPMAVVFSALVGLAAPAAAEPESVHIEYVAPAGCPTATAFLRSLRARTTRFRAASPDEPARHFSVRVAPAASSFAGRLQIDGPAGSAVRTLEGRMCGDVVDALALMTALAIDPSALGPGPNNESRPADSERNSRVPPRPENQAAADPPSPSAPPWPWSAGLDGHLAFHLTPGASTGGSVFVETENPTGAAFRAGIFVNQAHVDVATPVGATATLQWAAVELDGCPVRMELAGLTIFPCVAFHLGALRSEGQGIRQPNRAVNLWADLDPVLRLRFAVTARLFLEAQGALFFPLTRPEFSVLDAGSQTTTTAYSVPRWGGLLGIGVAYRFR